MRSSSSHHRRPYSSPSLPTASGLRSAERPLHVRPQVVAQPRQEVRGRAATQKSARSPADAPCGVAVVHLDPVGAVRSPRAPGSCISAGRHRPAARARRRCGPCRRPAGTSSSPACTPARRRGRGRSDCPGRHAGTAAAPRHDAASGFRRRGSPGTRDGCSPRTASRPFRPAMSPKSRRRSSRRSLSAGGQACGPVRPGPSPWPAARRCSRRRRPWLCGNGFRSPESGPCLVVDVRACVLVRQRLDRHARARGSSPSSPSTGRSGPARVEVLALGEPLPSACARPGPVPWCRPGPSSCGHRGGSWPPAPEQS